MIIQPDISISSVTHHVPQQSDSELDRFVFAYTITIQNNDETAYQLLSRHWVIQDGNMKVEEVYGDGVVGEQPIILPGENYSYTSGAVLETDMGTMEGRYFFCRVDPTSVNNKESEQIEILIPKFLLSVPRTIH